MGTWGVHSFENDDAREWSEAYREMGLAVAKSTIEVALGDHANNGLTADVACRAVAAVEAVALATGHGSQAAVEAFQGAPEADRSAAAELVPICNDVISAITAGSQLDTMWRDVSLEDHGKWVASLDELRARVNGAAAVPVAEPADQPAPVAEVAPDVSQDDLRLAIVELSLEMQAMRQEMHDNFLRLAKRIGALQR